MQTHNRDQGTSYRNWNDYSRAMRDSARRDQNIRNNMLGRRNRTRESHPFFGGPGQPRNTFGETDEEWHAGVVDPEVSRRKMDYLLGRDVPDSGADVAGSERGGGFGMRDGDHGRGDQSTAGWAGQSRGQHDRSHDAAEASGMASQESDRQDESEAFQKSFGSSGLSRG
jgi:hypothetical protein